MNACLPTEVESGGSLIFAPHCGQKFPVAATGARHVGHAVPDEVFSIMGFSDFTKPMLLGRVGGFDIINLMSRKSVIFIVVGILVIVAAGFWYWSKNRQTPAQQTPTIGGQIFEKTQNPLGGKLPETNPFKEQKNPFDVIYNNPFK